MIFELDFEGKTKVDRAIKMLQTFEPPEGYYLAFSGGKDSVTLKALADMAGVKYDAHYNVTSVDPPELVQFVKTFPDVKRDIPHDKNGKPVTMWSLIEQKKMLPLRTARFCCAGLKETQGFGRFVLTGVRWEESTRRKLTRGVLEYSPNKTGQADRLDPDNPANEKLFQFCPTKAQRRLNPIIDWTTEEVWEFIHHFNIRYCKLYDEGWKRLGCILCPMASKRERESWNDTRRLPKHTNGLYIERRKTEHGTARVQKKSGNGGFPTKTNDMAEDRAKEKTQKGKQKKYPVT